jgi:hypothetical protein
MERSVDPAVPVELRDQHLVLALLQLETAAELT